LLASQEYQQQQQQQPMMANRKRAVHGDSDSEDEQKDTSLGGDLYKKRMHSKTAK
jgi:hypothetical protein